MSRGALIVFEGLDRSGKSTQCSLVVQALSSQGVKVRHMRFPDRTTRIGEMIDGYLKGSEEGEDHVVHLMFCANRWEAAASIRSDVLSGVTVIIDRYYYSGCVYSAAKQIGGMSLEWCRGGDVGLPRPDLCVFLDVSSEVAEGRGGYGMEKYERKEMQDRVRELFETLMQKKEGEDFVRIDAGKSLEEVQARVRDEVQRCIERVEGDNKPLRVVEEW